MSPARPTATGVDPSVDSLLKTSRSAPGVIADIMLMFNFRSSNGPSSL